MSWYVVGAIGGVIGGITYLCLSVYAFVESTKAFKGAGSSVPDWVLSAILAPWVAAAMAMRFVAGLFKRQ